MSPLKRIALGSDFATSLQKASTCWSSMKFRWMSAAQARRFIPLVLIFGYNCTRIGYEQQLRALLPLETLSLPGSICYTVVSLTPKRE
jgi:hypothetical protein